MPNILHIRDAIRVMEDVRDNSRPFDIHSWVESARKHADCGTAACFAGWLTRDPYFAGVGFRYSVGNRSVRLKRKYDEEAVSSLLGIDLQSSINLVYSYSYPAPHVTPQMVIDRLTALLPDDEKGTAS